MVSLTFGEQVKIVLSRKGMTIKELAETIEERTGKKMSRQNLTQRLGRDNFQEQDMRMIAEILGCPFQLSILGTEEVLDPAAENSHENSENRETVEHRQQRLIVAGSGRHKKEEEPAARDITVGELVGLAKEEEPVKEIHVEDRTIRYINTDALRAAKKSGRIDTSGEEPQEESKRKPVTSVIREYIKKPILKSLQSETEKEPAVKEEELPEEPAAEAVPEVMTEIPEAIPAETAAEEIYAEETYAGETSLLPEEAAEDLPETLPEDEAEDIQEEETEEIRQEEPPVYSAEPETAPQEPAGEINPYTGREYETNSVRMHPKRIGYVQVYDRNDHKWTDMTEWAFLGYQERKKAMLGKDYEEPIYLD